MIDSNEKQAIINEIVGESPEENREFSTNSEENTEITVLTPKSVANATHARYDKKLIKEALPSIEGCIISNMTLNQIKLHVMRLFPTLGENTIEHQYYKVKKALVKMEQPKRLELLKEHHSKMRYQLLNDPDITNRDALEVLKDVGRIDGIYTENINLKIDRASGIDDSALEALVLGQGAEVNK